MRRLDRNRVVRLREEFEGAPKGAIARVLGYRGEEDEDKYRYAVQFAPCSVPRGFGHDGDGAVKERGFYVPRSVLIPTRVKVSGAAEFARKYRVRPGLNISLRRHGKELLANTRACREMGIGGSQ